MKTGDVLHNYKLEKLVGTTSYGQQFKSSNYSIQTLDLDKVSEHASTLEKEAQILKQISGNPVCNKYMSCYYNYFIDNQKTMVLVTDFISGESLQKIIVNQVKHKNFSTPRLLQLMTYLAEAVDYIHNNGVAHQNIKPSNIILDKTDGRLKLIDFAFSCSYKLNSECKGKVGTVYYMPPELLESKVDPSQMEFYYRSTHDIWSTGVVFYQMANPGHDYMEFTSRDPAIISKEIQVGTVKESKNPYVPVNSVIKTMLNKDWEHRPTSGQVVILLSLARPLCIVNDISYSRDVALSTLEAMNIHVPEDIDDYSLCKRLTAELNICKIKEKTFNRRSLFTLAETLNLDVDGNIDTGVLCTSIQNALLPVKKEFKEKITGELLRALEYISFIRPKADDPKIRSTLSSLESRYTELYFLARDFDLIDSKILKNRLEVVETKYRSYRQNASIYYSNIYESLANSIKDVIAAQVNT